MKSTMFIIGLVCSAIVLQLAFIPAVLPPVLRPDIGIMLAMLALSFGQRETGLVAVFALGVQADLFCSQRFGLLTLCYLLAAGIVLFAGWRELGRGNLLAIAIGAVVGTALAHSLYIVFGKILGLDIPTARAIAMLVSLIVSATLWSFPVGYGVGKLMFKFGTMSPAVNARWAAEERLAATRRGVRA